MPEAVKYFDTTLRDGTQGEGFCLSVDDKLRIASRLDALGIHYIEGGWPGSNPKDMEFFQRASKMKWKNARIVAFGSTCRVGQLPQDDMNLNQLIQADTQTISIFGKSWLLHVHEALCTSPEENIQLIRDSVSYLKKFNKEVVYDAEHFFDGYKDNPDYALLTLKTAQESGADWIVLCDTNGGTLSHEIGAIICRVRDRISTPIGIHAHNDAEMAVANSIEAVLSGCSQVQGTINGYGERSGNANLCSIIPILQLKLGYFGIEPEELKKITSVSNFVSEIGNLPHQSNLPFVGRSAFAHKGGIHVSAVMKRPETYEHLNPSLVGNERRVLISDLSGQSNIRYKAKALNLEFGDRAAVIPEIIKVLKEREFQGYSYEAAEASLDLLIKQITGKVFDLFELKGFRLMIEKNEGEPIRSEATIRLLVNGEMEHTAAEAPGPVHALDIALRKALVKFYPEISEMKLEDYKVRVLNEKDGTNAQVRVLIDSGDQKSRWGTVGVSENIIEASWQALMESFYYFLLNRKAEHNYYEIQH